MKMEVETHQNCGLTKPHSEHVCADDCVKGRGRFYQGTVNKTKQGLPCQHWDSQLPHSHNRPPDVFPEVQNAENFCRNAGGEEPSPWCYTMDPTVRWQHCDIPVCGKCHSNISRCINWSLCSTFLKVHSKSNQLACEYSGHLRCYAMVTGK